MLYTDLEEIKKDFDLSESEPSLIRKKLRKIMTQLHPDRVDGDNFKTPEDKEKYLKIVDAIRYIDEINNDEMLVPLNTKKLVAKIEDRIYQIALENRLSERINETRIEWGMKYQIPKISTLTISAILTIIWAVPQTLAEHPMLDEYENLNNNPFFTQIWKASLISTFILWVFVYIMERRTNNFLKKLKTEKFQEQLFSEFLHSKSSTEFSKDEFVDFLSRWDDREIPTALSQSILVDSDIAESLSDVLILKAETKGIIRKIDSKTLTATYIFNILDNIK